MANTQLLNNLSIVNPGSLAAPKETTGNLFRRPESPQKIQRNIDDLTLLELLQFPIDRPKYYTNINVYEYSRTSMLRLGNMNLLKSIVLPLPLSMIDMHQVEYRAEELNTVMGTALETGAKAAGFPTKTNPSTGPMSNISDAARKLGGSGVLGNILGTGATALTGAAVAGAELAGTQDQKTALRGFLGYSPNQFLTILLKGPTYKQFELTWKLAPRNEQESRSIRQIIRYMNNSMAPGLGLGGAIFTFPAIFDIGYIPNSKFLYKFKPAVMQSLMANYAAGGQPAFYRASDKTNKLNAPESIEIRCSFMELEYWLTGDFNNSNDPYNRDIIAGEGAD